MAGEMTCMLERTCLTRDIVMSLSSCVVSQSAADKGSSCMNCWTALLWRSIVDSTAAWRDNNQSGVTRRDNFLPIDRVDRPPDSICPVRPADRPGLPEGPRV